MLLNSQQTPEYADIRQAGHPWGDQWDSNRANSSESKLGKTTPVGSYPDGASPYGAFDMAGNVWQWVADWYDKSYYQPSSSLISAVLGVERNPRGPDSGSTRVLRGGSWNDYLIALRAATRVDGTPGLWDDVIGFRCARGLP